jgi:hypothetical protein
VKSSKRSVKSNLAFFKGLRARVCSNKYPCPV